MSVENKKSVRVYKSVRERPHLPHMEGVVESRFFVDFGVFDFVVLNILDVVLGVLDNFAFESFCFGVLLFRGFGVLDLAGVLL